MPLQLPSIGMLTGPGAVPFLRRRLESAEDRYMELYGKKEWASSNMDLCVHVAPGYKSFLVDNFLDRLDRDLLAGTDSTKLYREEADFTGDTVTFHENRTLRADDLLKPRRGIYLDLDAPDRIRVVWNHMQTDGVGMWSALRPLFDENPPLIPYKDVPVPPPVLPELLALPSVARRLTWRGRLREGMPEGGDLTRGLARWDAEQVRARRDETGGAFNLVSSAMAISEVFQRHLDRDRLNVGLTAYFPFLNGRNKYGVFMCKVRRGDLKNIVAQLAKQTRHQMVNWGQSAAQSFALRQLPDRAFSRLVNYYRQQIDVLVSSLPVGQRPITLGGLPAVISCHPWELTLPYYFLLVGTRQELHVSFTSRYRQDASFLNVAPLTAAEPWATGQGAFATAGATAMPPLAAAMS